ncbi:hypothetical protein PW853_000197 [Campylobacter coli]|nr:hypothetical protein [Campylobacter coli]EKT7760951.1 hypothetical protein [Campylobacter coli]EKT7779102.1 hypothetical protein [Campylobacter coli]HED6133980.1 hypothetical protein [Campylobacter coli]HED6161766.1 hypothetical protein [Campylobacter coli]
MNLLNFILGISGYGDFVIIFFISMIIYAIAFLIIILLFNVIFELFKFSEKITNIINNKLTFLFFLSYPCLGIAFALIFIVLFGEANKSYIEKINKKYNINLEAIQSIGFGVCNNSDYASQTCKNYLRYFENSLERSIAQIKKEEIEKYHTEKVKNKFY